MLYKIHERVNIFINANEFLGNKSVYRLDTRPFPHVGTTCEIKVAKPTAVNTGWLATGDTYIYDTTSKPTYGIVSFPEDFRYPEE